MDEGADWIGFEKGAFAGVSRVSRKASTSIGEEKHVAGCLDVQTLVSAIDVSLKAQRQELREYF